MPSDRSKLWKAVGIILFVGLMVALAAWLTPWLMAQALLLTARDKLVDAGLPETLATGLMWLLGIPFVLALLRALNPLPGNLGRGWPKSRPVAIGTVAGYLGTFYVTLFAMTKDNPTGPYYCPVGCIHYFKRAGECPRHLVALQPVTAQVIVTSRRIGCKGAQKIENLGPDGPFRDIATNAILVYLGHDHRGRLVPYDGPGFDPIMGGELRAATPDMVVAWQQQCAGDAALAAATHPTPTGGDPRRGGGPGPGRAASGKTIADPPRRSIAPSSPWSHMSMGELINLASMQPDNARLHYYIGQRYLDDGDQAGAVRSFREALRANPGFAAARTELEKLGEQP